MVENDYHDKLSPEEREWLDKFNQAHVGGNPELMYRKKSERRELWRDRQKIRRDAMSYVREELCIDAIDVDVNTHADGGRELRETVRANQEDVIIALLDENVCPTGENLKDRARARRDSREFDEAALEAQAAAMKSVTRARKRKMRQ